MDRLPLYVPIAANLKFAYGLNTNNDHGCNGILADKLTIVQYIDC